MKFETSKTYSAKSICDHNCIWEITVLSRTAKTIKIKKLINDDGKPKTLRISMWDGVETVKPLGSYSMAPMIRAAS